jgi:hypothetical protein
MNFDGVTPMTVAEVDNFFGQPQGSPMANSNGQWQPDWVRGPNGAAPATFEHVLPLDPENKTAVAIEDSHYSSLAYALHQQTQRKYVFNSGGRYDFKMQFRDVNGASVGDDFLWGYSYTNDSYAWRLTDTPHAPVALCVSPSQNGAQSQMITGYGDFTDNFTGLEYVEDINNP